MNANMALAKCLLFTANIYDKNRCKNCYRPKEVHSGSALEKNKVCRKISKCGYLFVAPDSFDFKSPLDCTRRWQRRFFILYDDGELTYSVDENVNTVPQGVIDMNKCCDVFDAENITSHACSIAVATADHITYIKGAGKEETNRWHDVLVMYPRSAKTKHKRSPTFPQTSNSQLPQPSKSASSNDSHNSSSNSSVKTNDPAQAKRLRYHSVASSTVAMSDKNYSGLASRETLSKLSRDAAPRIGDSGRSKSLGEPLGSKRQSSQRNGEVASASVASSSNTTWRSEPQPLTYRGVRSLKHRHDKSYAEGIRKSSSLHDLAAPSDESGGETPSSPLAETRARSRSRDSLTGSGQWVSSKLNSSDSHSRALSKSCDDIPKSDTDKPKTFFEFLVSEPPPKPPTKNSRYMRFAGIPQARSVSPSRNRHQSGPTTDLECMEANHIVSETAKFWEAKSTDSIDSTRRSRSDLLHSDHTDVGVIRSSRSYHDLNKASGIPSLPNAKSVSSLIETTTGGRTNARSDRSQLAKDHPASRIAKSKAVSTSSLTSTPQASSNLNQSKKSSNTSNKASSGKTNITRSKKIAGNSHTNPTKASVHNSASAEHHATTNSPPPPPWRSSSHKYTRSAMSAKSAIPASNRTKTSWLNGRNALPQDQTTDRADQQQKTSSPRARNSTRGISRGRSSSGDLMYRSHSPTSSLLLNGRSKNETDEHKMAKSDFTSPGHASEDVNRVESSPSPDEQSHDTDLEYMKKGWLVKQGASVKDWTKYWFVLSGTTLKYYTDMEAEKSGHETGKINLAICYDMLEVVVARKYGFQLRTKDGDHTLSALTLGIRKNWMQAIGQCVQSNGGPLSSSSSSQESSPLVSRRGNDRYHTHSGAFITRSQSRETSESPRESSPRADTDSASRKSSGIPTRRTEVPASDPPKYAVRRTGANEISVTAPNGNTEKVRMRSRRRTTENVTQLPEPSDSDSSQANRHSCTWPYEVQKPEDRPRSNSTHSLKSSQDSGSQRDLSQYLEQDEKPPELSQQEVAELDNVQRNIRHIHRRSLTESVQVHKLKHLDKFESGAAFNGDAGPDNQSTSDYHRRSRSLEPTSSPSNPSSRDSSNNRTSPRSQTPTRDALPSESSSSANYRTPTAKIKSKSRLPRAKSPKSPPPETLDNNDHYLDTFVRRNLEGSVPDDAATSTVMEKKWKNLEKKPERPPPPSSESVGDVLVDFWEAEVESLKGQLDRTQNQLTDVQKQNTELRIQLRRSTIEQADYVSDLELYQSRFIPQMEDYNYLEQTSEVFKNRMTDAENTAQRAIQQMQELKSKLKETEEHVQYQEEQIKALQSKLSVSMSELNKLELSLTQSAEELHSEQDSSQKIIEELEARIEKLQKELREKVNLVHNRDQVININVEKIQSLELTLEESDNRIEHLKADVQSCSTLKREIEEKTNLAASMKQETDILRQQLREQDGELQKSQMVGINKVKTIEDEFYREKEVLELRLEQMQKHMEQITKQSNMADSLNANMADILKEKDETIAQLEEKLIEFEARVEELSEELHLEVEDNSNLNATLEQAQKEEKNLKQQINELQHELTELEEEYNKLTNEARDLNKKLSEKDTERELLTQDLERVESQLKELENMNVKSREQISRSNKSDDYENLEARYVELCEDLDRANKEIMVLSERLDIEQREKESVQTINNEAIAEVDQVRNLYEVALRDLNESQNNTSTFEEKLKNKDRQNHSDLQAKEQELHDLRFELTQYKAGHEQIGNKLRNLEKAKKDISDELEKQKKQYKTEMEEKSAELMTSQNMLDQLHEKLNKTETSMTKESQYLLQKSSTLERSDSAQSSPRGETFYSDIPSSFEDLKSLYKKLLSEHRDQKRELQEISIRLEEADSLNGSLKQHLKNLETGYQGQVDQLSSRVQELTTQLSNIERRNIRLERRTRSQEVLEQVDVEIQTDATEQAVTDPIEQQHVQEMQNELDLSDAKVNQLMNRVMQQRSFEVELDLLHQQLENLEEENRQHRERLGSLSSEDEAFKDYNPSGQLRELKLKVKQGRHFLGECSKKLLDVQCRLDRNQDKQGEIWTLAKDSLKSAIMNLDDAKSLIPTEGTDAGNSMSDDVKMRLFSERLSLEAVILGEMSYLVRSEQAADDQSIRDLYSARGKASEITLQLYKQYCPEAEDPEIAKEKSLSTFATLLSEKLRIQTQLLLAMDDIPPSASSNVDVFVSDNKKLQQVARTGLNQTALSMFLASSFNSPISNLGTSHAMTRTDLACTMKTLHESATKNNGSTQEIISGEHSRLCRELTSDWKNLEERLAPIVDKQTQDITLVLLQCDKCGADESLPSLELFSEELRHVTKSYLASNNDLERFYSEAFSNHLYQTVDEHIHKLLQDIECAGRNISAHVTESDNRDSTELEQDRTRSLLQLGYLVSQMSIVQALVTFFETDQSPDTQTTSFLSSSGAKVGPQSSIFESPLPMLMTSSLLSSPQDKAEVATMLARKAATRNDLASFMLNNTAQGEDGTTLEQTWQEQIVNLSSKLLDLDLELMDHNHKGLDYMSLIEKEAIIQAQLSYVIQYLRLKHKAEMKQLQKQLNKSEKSQHIEKPVESDTDHEEEIEELSYELESAHKQRAQVEEIAADLESELQRKENNYRQEVQALKDGYDIRIRSLQADLDVAKEDLEKIQQENEMESHQFEESFHASIIEYETKIEKLVSEKEEELSKSAEKIQELEDEISKLMAEKLKWNSSSEEEHSGRSLTMSLEDAEVARERMEEIDTLRQQLEEEKKRHVTELERLQQVLQGDNNAAAQALLTSKIQQLEERIHSMQLDYEQELSIQKAAHRRELARSKDDMMQLLATAEEKSMYIDEEAMRKRYMKEIERIRVLYDRSFGAIEKSHQKVIVQMRKAHKRELDMLRMEKDQVLAEETKATQAALDAMRKAHERELQKERNKFLDVIAKTYSLADVESLQKQHEADLDLIQGELKDLSEQYSFRCLEKVSLEQRLWGQSSMVQKCRKHIQELMASREEVISRNKQDIEKLKRQMLGNASATTPSDGQNTQVLLKVKDAEINQLGDEIKMLKDQLQGTIEELEENMEKYHELHAMHNVAQQRHQREVEELNREIQHQSKMAADLSDDSICLDSPRDEETNEEGSDLVTSTPLRVTGSIPEDGGLMLSEVKVKEKAADQRKVKKALWRQKEPQRAHSTPGLTEEMTLTLKKQMSIDHMTTSKKIFDVPDGNKARILRTRLSLDSTEPLLEEKL